MKVVTRSQLFETLVIASAGADLDAACAMIQDLIGQTDGGCAGIFFSGMDLEKRTVAELWPAMRPPDRFQRLSNYAEYEANQDNAPFYLA